MLKISIYFCAISISFSLLGHIYLGMETNIQINERAYKQSLWDFEMAKFGVNVREIKRLFDESMKIVSDEVHIKKRTGYFLED